MNGQAREYFGCDTLDGVELEDSGGDGTALGHWDQRLMRYDTMVGEEEDEVRLMLPRVQMMLLGVQIVR